MVWFLDVLKQGLLKLNPKYANGAKHKLMRANQGIMYSNDQLVIICVIILIISLHLILIFGMSISTLNLASWIQTLRCDNWDLGGLKLGQIISL